VERTLGRLVSALSTAATYDEAADAVMTAIRVSIGADAGALLITEDTQHYFADSTGLRPLEQSDRASLILAMGARALTEHRTIVEACTGDFRGSIVVSPIREQGALGIVAALWDDPRHPTSEEILKVTAVANTTAVGIDNLKLRESLELQEVERVHLEASRESLEFALYSMAHDLRSPLFAMMAYGELLSTGHAAPGDVEMAGTSIRDAGQRMADQIDRLLAVYRASRTDLRVEVVDLSALAAEVITDLHSREPEREMVIDIEPRIQVLMDPVLAHLVLENLLGNAFKYTGTTATAKIAVHAVAGGFAISDNGVGFDPALSDRLFLPLSRLHGTEFPGTGLGLASVARIVEHHGGRVAGTGEIGSGATFQVLLPRQRGRDDLGSPGATAARPSLQLS
jgi:signal transduction histidine kinase